MTRWKAKFYPDNKMGKTTTDNLKPENSETEKQFHNKVARMQK